MRVGGVWQHNTILATLPANRRPAQDLAAAWRLPGEDCERRISPWPLLNFSSPFAIVRWITSPTRRAELRYDGGRVPRMRAGLINLTKEQKILGVAILPV